MQTSDLVRDFLLTHWPYVLLNALLVGMVPLAELVALPWFYGQLMDAMRRPGDVNNQNRLLAGMCAVVAAIQGAQVLRDYANQWLIPTLDGYMKAGIVDRVLQQNEDGCDPMSTGDVVYILTTISDLTTTWLTWLNDFVLPYTLTFLITTVTFFRYDRWTGILFTVFLLLLGSLVIAAPNRCSRFAREHSASMANVHTDIEELVHNADAVQTYDRRSSETHRLRENISGRGFQHYHQTNACTRTYKIIMIPILVTMLCLFVLRSRFLLNNQRVTHQHFMTVFLVLIGLLGSVFWITDTMSEMVLDTGHIAGVMDNMRGIQRTKPATPDHPPPAGALGLFGVTFSHDQYHVILNNVTMTFDAGERTALIGPVGSGKSTVLRILAGICQPQKGQAFLGGRWYSAIGTTELRRTIGYVPQTPVLFRGTVLSNIMYGAPENVNEEEVVKFVRTWTTDTFQNKLHDDVGPLGKKLSGGQRQLVWCLRMLLRPPPIILMDEPTASMDVSTKDTLLRLLDALMDDRRTVIVVTHDTYLLSRCTRTISMTEPAA